MKNKPKQLDEIKLASHLQRFKNNDNKDSCRADEYKRLCKPNLINPCKRDWCHLLKHRASKTLQDRASMSIMQSQLEAALKMTVPKYAKRPKPTPGKGQGCGSPPRRILPPLWMYSMATQKPKPSIPPRDITHKSRHKHNTIKFKHNYADEIGTHRYHLPS